MKKYREKWLVKTGSQALNKVKESGKKLDIILLPEKKTSFENWIIGKKVSKSRNVARYYNKFWRLGILDSDLHPSYVIQKGRFLIVDFKLEKENKIARDNNLHTIFLTMLKTQGIIKASYVFVLLITNKIYKKFRLLYDC